MSSRRQLYYGGVPVPYTVAWTGEKGTFLARCPHARSIALCNPSARGEGKPDFGRPHANRQREAIVLGLCDLCGGPLKNRTKVSLSHARPQPHAAHAWDVLQVEPLLHRECATVCLGHCPSLKHDRLAGTLMIRHVHRHACQFAIFSEQGTFELTGERRKAISHAKVQLIAWTDRDLDWLTREKAGVP